MGLKLTVSRGDKVVMDNGIVIDLVSHSDRQVTVEVHAPQEVKVNAIFLDSSKQFKNMRHGK